MEENKAQIIIYDDFVIIDETEAFFKDNEQLAGIASSAFAPPRAQVVEVYVKDKLKMKFRITNRGKIKKESLHPGWGGARRGAGCPRKGEGTLEHRIGFRVNSETLKFLDSLLDKKGEFIRQAIKEKRERDKEKG